jgi:mannose/fructose/N-acetylgalactosamine-specific phosphotransferase system component IIC
MGAIHDFPSHRCRPSGRIHARRPLHGVAGRGLARAFLDRQTSHRYRCASILAGLDLGHVSRELVAFSVLLFIPCGYGAQRVDSFIVKSNDVLYDGALQDAQRADIGGIFRKHLSGLVKHFLAYLALILVSLFGGVNLILYIYPLLPEAFVNALSLIFIALPLLGVAAGLNTLNLKRAIPVFSALFLSISLLWELIHVF